MEQLLDEHELGTSELKYAGFWMRFAAVFIDGLILAIPNLAFTFLLKDIPFLPNILSLVVNVGYYAYFESSDKQATPGKSMLGLKVVDSATLGKISFGNALGRYFAKILSTIILFIGFLMMLFNDKKQTLHDKLAGTYVVTK